MQVRWFGEPWGVGGRAPICDDDAYKIDPPVDSRCIECAKPIKANDRGAVTNCSPSIFGSWKLTLHDGEHSVCSYHLLCFLEVTIGGEIAGRVLERMEKEPLEDDIPAGMKVVTDEPPVPGRGWKKEPDDPD